MQSVSQILASKNHNDNNVNRNRFNNDINVNNESKKQEEKKYALNRKVFTPGDEKSQLAEEMATKMNDLKNFACYYNLVNRRGVAFAMQLLSSTLSDIQDKLNTKTPVRKPGAYMMWKLKNGKY